MKSTHPEGAALTKVQGSFVRIGFGVLLLALLACSSSETRNQYARREDGKPLVDEKYSLKADRDALNKYRSEESEDVRRQNDESAMIPQLFQDTTKEPSKIREKFDSIVRKKREVFDKDINKERERFTNEERKNREAFLKDQKSERDSFMREKTSKEKRDDFFKTQEDKRKDYFSNQREKRDDFESDVRERRKNFEDYVREKQNEFNSEYRSYSRRFDEWKKQKEEERRQRENSAFNQGAQAMPVKKSNPEAEALERELNDASGMPSNPLNSGE